MKTAVEWLAKEIQEQLNMFFPDATLYQPTIDKAKEMEKEQMEKVWVAGLYCETGDRQAFIDYYNETFKSE
jgi:hypothetical protein